MRGDSQAITALIRTNQHDVRRFLRSLVPGADVEDATQETFPRMLRGLPADRRDALLLTQVAGLSHAEAAGVLGCPIGTARSRVARARSDLTAGMSGR